MADDPRTMTHAELLDRIDFVTPRLRRLARSETLAAPVSTSSRANDRASLLTAGARPEVEKRARAAAQDALDLAAEAARRAAVKVRASMAEDQRASVVEGDVRALVESWAPEEIEPGVTALLADPDRGRLLALMTALRRRRTTDGPESPAAVALERVTLAWQGPLSARLREAAALVEPLARDLLAKVEASEAVSAEMAQRSEAANELRVAERDYQAALAQLREATERLEAARTKAAEFDHTTATIPGVDLHPTRDEVRA